MQKLLFIHLCIIDVQGKFIGLRDDSMERLQGLLSNNLEAEKVNDKIQKIIFDIIFQHVQDMVFVMRVEKGPVFRYLFVNEAGLKKAQLTTKAFGKTMEEVLPKETAQFLQEKYKLLVNTEKAVMFDDVFLYDGGKEVYGETILTPIWDDHQSLVYIVAVTRDTTVWWMEKNKLIESEQRYRSIVENNMDAIFTISIDGKILESNPAASMLTGYSEKQMRNRSIYNLINDYDLDKFKKLIENTCTGLALESLDCKIIHNKGQIMIVHIKTVPIAVHGDIKGLYIICKDLSEQSKNMEMIRFMAFHDQLTGLLNRRALIEHLNEHIFSQTNHSKQFALLSIDLDRFKYLNDTLGHLAGDEILKRVSSRLQEYQNDKCYVYRQGGDEFNLLLLDRTRHEATRFVQKIFSSFAQSLYLNSHEYFISFSIGISMYPSDGKDAEMLIKNADEALFRVKEKGKGHFQFYRSEMNTVFNNVVQLETQLRKAIDKNELVLFYQPQIDINSGEAKSFEALLRWETTEFGAVSPSVFIPLAEDTGLIIPIGNWVIESACKQIRKWEHAGYRDFQIAVNISLKQFQQPNFATFIRAMIDKYHINPASLGIEITESAMSDKNEAIPILNKLKELGVSISVDDFGTGYSSLNYLKQFPIDVLKIDQSFIRDILIDEKDAAITTTIIHLGRSLGLEVIAEGVELSEQVEFLKDAMCHKIQGYYYSKPIPVDATEQLFLKKSLIE
jgi:diguanylate cyclase (GGDEF)-like protein/PAS domain S-box-containing protein